MDYSQLLGRRSAVKGHITRIEKWLDEYGEVEGNAKQFNLKLETLCQLKTKYIDIQDNIESIKDYETLDSEDRYATENRIDNLIVAVQDSIECLSPLKSKDLNQQNFIQSSAQNVKLPEIKIQPFTGNFSEFSTFFQLFTALISDNPVLTDIQKFLYLKSLLRDEPLQLIQTLPVEHSSFQIALDILKDRYENKLSVVNSYLKNLVEIEQLKKCTAANLRKFINDIKQNLDLLKKLNYSFEQLWELLLIYLFEKKLDFSTRKSFESERNANALPSIHEFLECLKKKCLILENLASTESGERKPIHKVSLHSENSQNNSKNVQRVQRSTYCNFCKASSHKIYSCDQFKKLSFSEKQKFINEKRLCFNCLCSNHSRDQCSSISRCSLCSQKHHTLLHNSRSHLQISNSSSQTTQGRRCSDNFCTANSQSQTVHSSNRQTRQESPQAIESRKVENSISQDGANSDQANIVTMSSVSKNNSCVLLATALITVSDKHGNQVPCRALLDSASQNSFVTERLVHKLNLSPLSKSVNVCGIAQSALSCSKMVSLHIHSKVYKNVMFQTSCIILSEITTKLPQVCIDKDRLSLPPQYRLSDPDFNIPSKIDMLLGADLYYDIILEGIYKLGKNLPVLQNTKLGWVIAGNAPISSYQRDFQNCNRTAHSSVSMFVNTTDQPSSLETLVEKFWALEEVPQTKIRSEEEQRAEEIFLSTTQILENGRYQVDLPFKIDPAKLGDSFVIAKKRFENLRKKLVKDPSYFSQYKSFIDEYISLGHAEIVPSVPNDLDPRKYFLPHHAVIRQQSTTTKLRVVFDGSCKTTSQLSLNDVLLKGYQVQPDLFDILCRFRSFKFVLTADIKKMFRQILINPDQRYLLNILWQNNPEEELVCIQLSTVTYGTNCAPFLATRVLEHISDSNSRKFPLASRALKRQCYVDDILCGVDEECDLETIHSQLSALLESHGFELHKWCSNSSKFLKTISQGGTPAVNLEFDDNPNKVLGLIWNPTLDCLANTIPTIPKVEKVTKRKILSSIAQCYDPLGLLAPVIVRGKLLMQKLWALKLEWDTEITDTSIISEWTHFINHLPLLTQLKISRFLFLSNDIMKIEFHGFADSSTKAYAACVYARSFYSNGLVYSQLIASKSRVAPLKVISLPRLELCAMLLLSKLTSKLIEILKDQVSPELVILWTDSLIALHWITSQPSRWSTFVANRVSQIQQLTSKFVWRHVRSSENPADLPSRGISSAEILNCNLWWNGPTFLQQPNSDFFKLPTPIKIGQVPEEKKVSLVTSNQDTFWTDIFARFSRFSTLQRTIAYILRFKNIALKSDNRSVGPLSVSELNHSLTLILSGLQGNHFAKEKSELTNNQPISDKSLQGLCLFLDENKLIRVGGRLRNADISFDQKHPILLPSHNETVSQMLFQEHLRLGHAGAQTVLSNFRLKYWPINGLRQAKNVIRKCIICFRFRAQPIHQIMADLPKQRLETLRPFTMTGVDYGGPFYIKFSHARRSTVSKAYLALFICMSTKAVHLELVSDLSTRGFIAAFHRFISRRGNPSKIFCDNATNFVGANNQLHELYNFFKSQNNNENLQNFFAQNEIEFKFIPPLSPHWGGLWESSIKAVKYHLKRLIGTANLTFEEFYTVLTRVEAILNSRPLCALSNDPNDLQVLTPGHFLTGSSLSSYPEKDVSQISENRLKRWERLSQMHQNFWKRWSVEYFNILQNRPKWKKSTPDLKVNDLVLIKENDTPPLLWPLARVLEIFPGLDNKVRVVKLKTKNGVFTRNITRLCPLPYSENLEE